MISETRLSYQLSRWTLVGLMVLAIPLVCIPVRGQEKGPAAPGASSPADLGTAADGKKAKTAQTEPATTGDLADADSIDAKTRELAEAARKRLTTYSGEKTLTLKDGQTGRMKVKKNVTPVAEILITPHFEAGGTKFDLEGVDAKGQAIEGTKTSSPSIRNAKSMGLGLGKQFSANGERILASILLKSTRRDDDRVAVDVTVIFGRMLSSKEIDAMHLTGGKNGRMQADYRRISRLIKQHERNEGHYPEDLKDLNTPLPKDVYSPTGEDYRYQAERGRFALGSCGKDGVYGNDDDGVYVSHGSRTSMGQRSGIYPLEELGEEAKKQTEKSPGERPRGNCSISGKVVSAATGLPVDHARMYLHYALTHGSIFVTVADDGTFVFKDIPAGPFSLQSSYTAGYQDASYDPEGKSNRFPQFSLEDGEQRAGIVLKIKPAYRISGKIRDESGKIPKNVDTLWVSAWVENDDGSGYASRRTKVDHEDGSYFIDGLDGKPAIVLAVNKPDAVDGNAYPPIYYPSTFSPSDAKRIAFDAETEVDGIDITLQKEGGLILEGTVTDEAGKPIPDTLVVVRRGEMHFASFGAHTDERGNYRLEGLGDGEFQVQLDAAERGFARALDFMALDGKSKKTQRNFTLKRGVMISGKFLDEEGNDWQIGKSHGYANVFEGRQESDSSPASSIVYGQGHRRPAEMLFPTKSTFAIQGLMPGQTTIGFLPKKENQKVLKILHDGQDIMRFGIKTKAGQEIKNVEIVIGTE